MEKKSKDMRELLVETKFLNFKNPELQNLIKMKNWSTMDTKEKIQHIYDFVRNDFPFGFNREDEMSASEILKDGHGQCNTKGILFMAILRACGIPCRIHAFLLDKKVQKGLLEEEHYDLFPDKILHTWIEVFYQDKWLDMEGIILDSEYLNSLQMKFFDSKNLFFGYGVGTKNLQNPEVDWNQSNTYIQKEGIIKDLGIYDSPDDLLVQYAQNMTKEEKIFFQENIMKGMNRNISKIRLSK